MLLAALAAAASIAQPVTDPPDIVMLTGEAQELARSGRLIEAAERLETAAERTSNRLGEDSFRARELRSFALDLRASAADRADQAEMDAFDPALSARIAEVRRLTEAGRSAEALENTEAIIAGLDGADRLSARHRLAARQARGLILGELEGLDAMLRAFADAVGAGARELPADDMALIEARLNFSRHLVAAARFQEGREQARLALDSLNDADPRAPSRRFNAVSLLADSSSALQDPPETTLALWQEAYQLARSPLAHRLDLRLRPVCQLAILAEDEAREPYVREGEELMQILDPTAGNIDAWACRSVRLELLYDAGDHQAVIDNADVMIDGFEAAGLSSWPLTSTDLRRSRSLIALQRYEDAEAGLRRAIDFISSEEGPEEAPEFVVLLYFDTLQAFRASGATDSIRALCASADRLRQADPVSYLIQCEAPLASIDGDFDRLEEIALSLIEGESAVIGETRRQALEFLAQVAAARGDMPALTGILGDSPAEGLSGPEARAYASLLQATGAMMATDFEASMAFASDALSALSDYEPDDRSVATLRFGAYWAFSLAALPLEDYAALRDAALQGREIGDLIGGAFAVRANELRVLAAFALFESGDYGEAFAELDPVLENLRAQDAVMTAVFHQLAAIMYLDFGYAADALEQLRFGWGALSSQPLTSGSGLEEGILIYRRASAEMIAEAAWMVVSAQSED